MLNSIMQVITNSKGKAEPNDRGISMDSSDRYTVADLSMSEAGRLKVEWARSRMPALASLRAKAEIERPLEGQ